MSFKRLLFFGADEFSLTSLQRIHTRGLVQNIELVCPADKPHGRGFKIRPSPLKQAAQSMGILVHSLPIDTTFTMKQWQLPLGDYDIGIAASFGYKLPPSIIQAFLHGIISIHPSLLPKYRGASPIQRCLINGDTQTGVSIVQLSASVDGGDILKQVSYEIKNTDTFSSLHTSLGELGGDTLAEVLNDLKRYKSQAIPQSTLGTPTYAPRLKREEGAIDWNASAIEVLRLWKGLHGYMPVFSTFRGQRIILRQCHHTPIIDLEASPQAGRMLYDANAKHIVISCGKGGWIAVKRLQIEYRKEQDAQSFQHGYQLPLVDPTAASVQNVSENETFLR